MSRQNIHAFSKCVGPGIPGVISSLIMDWNVSVFRKSNFKLLSKKRV